MASYALLSTPALLKPAVIGLDANIDDVALIEEAVDKAVELSEKEIDGRNVFVDYSGNREKGEGKKDK